MYNCLNQGSRKFLINLIASPVLFISGPNSLFTLGNLLKLKTGTAGVHGSAVGLAPGTYKSSLIARDFFNNKVIVPVTMHVGWPVGGGTMAESKGTGLRGIYPNPFAETTRICFSLERQGDVTFVISSAQGHTVRTMNGNSFAAGDHFLEWDGRNDNGQTLPAGLYTLIMKTGDYNGTAKLVLVR